jgi:choline dehydrogenase-like flavoprotein
MIIDCNSFDESKHFEADICIMGAGVAGTVLANELKGRFNKILLLDAGGENYELESQELYKAESFPDLFIDPHITRLRMLGGSSNHWQNNTSRLSPIDFKVREWVKNSGWPIQYHDLVDFYPKAEAYCGVESDGYDIDYWLKTLRLKNPIKNTDLIKSAITKSSVPPVRFFHQHGAPLKESSKVEVITHANVIKVHYDKTLKKINTVDFRSYRQVTHSASAKIFILCMGGIENARMLLSFNEQYDNQLGNQNGMVGRYFMEHPTVRAAYLYNKEETDFKLFQPSYLNNRSVVGFLELSEEALTEHKTTNLRLPLNQISNYLASNGISSFHLLNDESDIPTDSVGTHLWNIISELDMVIEAVSRKKFDKKLFDSANDMCCFEMVMMMEQTPHWENRVRLGNEYDINGVKKIVIDWQLHEEDKQRVWNSLDLVARGVGANDMGRVKVLRERSERLWGSQLGFSAHHMGTTKMGTSIEDSVVDKNLKIHDTNNFYVAGSSVFPTGGHVPPTLTITALAIRLARHIENNRGGYE